MLLYYKIIASKYYFCLQFLTKRMRYLALYISVIVIIVIPGCNGGSGFSGNDSKGGRVYGGTFKISETESINSLYPLSAEDVGTSNIAAQIYEGLVKLSVKDLSVIPSVAEKWEIDESGKVYTFHLKKGIYFHDDPCFPEGKGREVTAEDVKFTLENACTQNSDNTVFGLSLRGKLAGAEKYYEASAGGVKPSFDLEGVRVIDLHTIQITFTSSNSSFLYVLAMPSLGIIPKEGLIQYGNKLTVGTGPFRLIPGQKMGHNKLVLVKNKNYHGIDSLGNKLPFIDTLEVLFMNSKKAELEAFKQKKLHVVVGLPSESIKEIVEEQIADFQNKPPVFILDRSVEMATNFYSFNFSNPVFKNKNVRLALNYAIDREKIIDDVLRGEAFGPGEFGFTPPSIKGYDVSSIKGYRYDPEKARKLLADAGFPDGKNFPSLKLELNSGGYKNTSIAVEIQKQWLKVLNIRVDLDVVPMMKKLEDEKYGRADLFRSAWVADIPDPGNFLNLFYGKTVPKSADIPSFSNTSRYVNPKFDQLFEQAINEINQEKRYKLFAEAEQILMDDAAVIVLYYNESYVLLKADIRNYFANPMQYKDYSQIYFKKPEGEINQKG
jgi:oligopeptide transport system substrate-binding protein